MEQVCELPRNIPKADEPSLQLHYYRQAADYDKWGFWIWQQGAEGALYKINYLDEFGGIAVYPVSYFGKDVMEKGLGIIPRTLACWTKDCDADRLLSLSDYTLDENNYYHIYITQGDVNLYMDAGLKPAPAVTDAYFTSFREVIIMTSAPINALRLYENGNLLGETAVDNKNGCRFYFPEGRQMGFDKVYEAEAIFSETGSASKRAVSVGRLYKTPAFNSMYYYDGELGALYTKAETRFKVWSPVSGRITLNIYNAGQGGAPAGTYEMRKAEKGVFEFALSEDCEGKYYTYTVYNYKYPEGREIVDPYAKSAGLNGERGMIVDFSKTNPENWEKLSPIPYDRRETVIWETHVADVTSSETWTGTEKYRRRFLGMCESGTTYTENGVTVKTGFDHIKELGVNAVQLIPIFDQANDEGKFVFNWGYNPLNYNVLEGSYSTNPRDGYARIKEFKQLVAAYNEAGINIIMDVVYNHVNAAEGSNFDVLMPGYYFRYTGNGNLSNGSGCGNETASENPMFRKFMLDSVYFWANEYKLGGFRFDLMGLHDIETMNLIAEKLKKLNPNIIIFGEPWAGGASPLEESERAVQINAPEFMDFGQFNDRMRDALIKGGLNPASSLGWVTDRKHIDNKNVDAIIHGLSGETFAEGKILCGADKTVNYVTCHDNYTLFDRIHATGSKDEEIIKKMAVLANSVVMTSDGTAFMLAGEEMLRSKGGNANSYNADYKTNELDYALKIKNHDVFIAYTKLIAFKKAFVSMLPNGADGANGTYKIRTLSGGAAIQIDFTDSNGRNFRIVYANGMANGLTVDFSGYELQYASIPCKLTAETAIVPYQTVIAHD